MFRRECGARREQGLTVDVGKYWTDDMRLRFQSFQ